MASDLLYEERGSGFCKAHVGKELIGGMDVHRGNGFQLAPEHARGLFAHQLSWHPFLPQAIATQETVGETSHEKYACALGGPLGDLIS